MARNINENEAWIWNCAIIETNVAVLSLISKEGPFYCFSSLSFSPPFLFFLLKGLQNDASEINDQRYSLPWHGWRYYIIFKKLEEVGALIKRWINYKENINHNWQSIFKRGRDCLVHMSTCQGGKLAAGDKIMYAFTPVILPFFYGSHLHGILVQPWWIHLVPMRDSEQFLNGNQAQNQGEAELQNVSSSRKGLCAQECCLWNLTWTGKRHQKEANWELFLGAYSV